MTRSEQVRLIESRSWWHSIELGNGLVTPGKVPLTYLRRMLEALQFPDSFKGLTVLDIGAWDGFFSFEAEKRGAKRVVAYDLHPHDYYGFATAKRLLGSQVEYVQGSVYDLSPGTLGVFDVVLFFGVLYHLRYPLLAFDRIRDVTGECAVIETHHLDNRVVLPGKRSRSLAAIDPCLTDIALYQFYRNDELYPGDFSNWFAPNRRAIEEGLLSAGFQPEFLATWDDRIAFKATKLPGVAEYRRQTYEGLEWEVHPDGSQAAVWPLRDGTLSSLPVDGDTKEPAAVGQSLDAIDADRAQDVLRRRVRQAEEERDHLLSEVEALQTKLKDAEADRAARLDVLDAQGRRLGEVEALRNNLQAEVTALREHAAILEADRAARLDVIHAQGRQIGELGATLDAQTQRIERLTEQAGTLEELVRAIQSGRAYKVLRLFGRWRWLEQALARVSRDASGGPHGSGKE